jgi:adenine-specific DNA-methyltransferase
MSTPTIRKITASDPLAASADVVAENIAKLKTLFPELITEGEKGASINVDVLKQLVGDQTLTDAEEKFGLNWHGKRQARQLALTPSTGTLRPCQDESVDWDTTQNIFIEGDNLEVLKLLQKSYAGRVKMIYIDPPYNTGEDFVYKDEFRNSVDHYKQQMGWLNADGTPSTSLARNARTSGRFHTAWLDMIYPRLRVARDLLCHDGVVFVSIDDVEAAHLRIVCDGVFGEENFIAQMIWEGANKNDARQIGTCHEYVLVYAKNRDNLPREWGLAKDAVEPVLKEVARLKKVHGEDYVSASSDLAGWFRANKAKPCFAHRRFRNIDARGAYKEDDPTAPGGRRFTLKRPDDGRVIPLRANRGWGFDQDEFNRLVQEGRITFVTPTSIMVRRYLHETDQATPQSVFYQPARSASERLASLMGANVFDYPKDETVLRTFVEMATRDSTDECIVLDFFAGSGTTAEAVMMQNARDSRSRRYVLVQLPEPLDPDKESQKEAAAYCDAHGLDRNIAELAKQRIRLAGAAMRSERPMFAGDTGFRVYKYDSSCIAEWSSARETLPADLTRAVDRLESARTNEDLMSELLLKRGLDLCVPIESKTIASKKVHSVGAGSLIACLEKKITRADGEALALGIAKWHKELNPAGETAIVFRDDAFADDVVKTNVAAILEQHGLKNVRSL